MVFGERIFLLQTLIWSSLFLINVEGDFVNTKERRTRHIFPLLGYLYGYKIGQNFALQLPPFVLSPVIIMPTVNQEQSVNIQNVATDESFQENGDTFQAIMPVKLILNSSLENIETNFRSWPENNTSQGEKVMSLNNTLRQTNEATNSSTENNIERGELASTTENLETTEIEELTSFKYNIPTTINTVYPTAAYNHEVINSLQLTTASSNANLGHPNLDGKFTSNVRDNAEANETQLTKYNVYETEGIENELEESASAKVGLYQLTREGYNYPRPNTSYYNSHSGGYNTIVDQFSITTNSYREKENEPPLPPWHDDRWQRFSSLSKVVLPTSGFKPLAGLYYDGFLHKSLTKKSGFIPFDKHYYY